MQGFIELDATRELGFSRKLQHVIIGIDMGSKTWHLCAYDYVSGKKTNKRFKGSTCGLRATTWMKEKFVDAGRQVHAVYEAGRNGFWPARHFREQGITPHIIPINRLEIVYMGKRVKTDRLDGEFLSKLDPVVYRRLPQVYIPSSTEEDFRSLLREHEDHRKDCHRANQHILSIIARHKISCRLDDEKHRSADTWRQLLKDWEKDELIGTELPTLEAERIRDRCRKLEQAEAMCDKWRKKTENVMNDLLSGDDPDAVALRRQYDKLMYLKGIAGVTVRRLCAFLGDFQRFKNGKAIGSYVGYTPVPDSSGGRSRDKGISRAGNKRLRSALVEIAWLWLRHQPDSWLSKKYASRMTGRGRGKRIAVVAMARQLLVALYRYVVHNETIEGAVCKDGSPVPGHAYEQTP